MSLVALACCCGFQIGPTLRELLEPRAQPAAMDTNGSSAVDDRRAQLTGANCQMDAPLRATWDRCRLADREPVAGDVMNVVDFGRNVASRFGWHCARMVAKGAGFAGRRDQLPQIQTGFIVGRSGGA